MAKGSIMLADTHDLTVNPGDGEQNYVFLVWWDGGQEDLEKLWQFKHSRKTELHFEN